MNKLKTLNGIDIFVLTDGKFSATPGGRHIVRKSLAAVEKEILRRINPTPVHLTEVSRLSHRLRSWTVAGYKGKDELGHSYFTTLEEGLRSASPWKSNTTAVFPAILP